MCPSDNMRHLQGFISWDQTMLRELSNPASITQAFKVLDRDGDGEIRSRDLWDFFGTCMCLSMSQEEADAMIIAADLDGDGAVNLAEFRCLVGIGMHAVSGNRAANLENDTHLVSEIPVPDCDNSLSLATDSSGYRACKTAEFDHGKGAINLAEFQCPAVNNATTPFGRQSESHCRVRCGAQAGLGSEFRRLSVDQFLSLDPDTEALLWEIFCVLDADKDGLLNPHDLKCAMSACGCPSVSDADLHAMLAAYDRADGLPCASAGMDFKSFVRLLSI